LSIKYIMFSFRQRLDNKSFTLIELLIVIAILALLMSIIIITLNPSEILKQTRDTKRISNLKSINNALSIFQATRPTASTGTANIVYISVPDSSATCANLGLPALPDGYTYACSTTANYRKTDGTGWIPVNFDSLDIGSPISSLPIDPTNTTSTGLFFSYVIGSSWEFVGGMESSKYQTDAAQVDGGTSITSFEIGSALSLTPAVIEEYKKDSDLVGYWSFDYASTGSIANAATTGLADESGNGNNCTASNANGTGLVWATGKKGGAVYFDGVDDYLNCGAGTSIDFPTGDFTLSFWFKPSATTSGAHIIDKGTGSLLDGYGVIIGDTNTTLVGAISFMTDGDDSGGGKSYTTGTTILFVDNWYYITAIRISGVKYLYINGVNEKSGSDSREISDSSRPLYMAQAQVDNNRWFNGNIDEVRIYNRALTADEIKLLYAAQ
jgi:prepilin-type N-terminal cleavage/methylation domain-containing protein